MPRGSLLRWLTAPPLAGAVLAALGLWLVVAAAAGPSAPSVAVVAVGGSPSAVAFGDGALWVAAGDRVTRVAARSLAVSQARMVGLCQDSQVAYGVGAVWVTSGSCGPGAVYRIDPRTLAVSTAARIPAYVEGVAVWDGRVWVGALVNGSAWSLIGLTATGRRTADYPLATGLDVLAGAPSGLYAETGGGRFEPLLGRDGSPRAPRSIVPSPLPAVPAMVDLPFRVTSITAGAGFVWAAGYDARRIARIGG